jgi:hypothetical protein
MNTNPIKVAVHGVPRSGTSWIGEILNSSPHTIYRFQPLFSYALKDFLTNASTKHDIELFFQKLFHIQDRFIDQTDKRTSGDFPRFEKRESTHIVYKEVRYINILCNMMRRTDDLYLCAVIRNPLSVINSWLRAPREFRGDLGWEELEEWRYAIKKNLNKPEEFNGYEKWKEAALVFRNLKTQYPNRVFIAKYDHFLANPIEETKKLFKAIALPLKDSTTEFILRSSSTMNSDPYSVFRSNQRDTKWKKELNPVIAQQILLDIEGTELQEYI